MPSWPASCIIAVSNNASTWRSVKYFLNPPEASMACVVCEVIRAKLQVMRVIRAKLQVMRVIRAKLQVMRVIRAKSQVMSNECLRE